MLGEEGKEQAAAVPTRKPYLRSVSWAGRSPSNSDHKPQPNSSNRPRSGLPPLSITRRPVEEWPRAGSDDLGVWPNPQTPRGEGLKVKPLWNSSTVDREFQFKRDKLAFFDKECSRIADHIYLGSDAVAKNREILQQNGITHVLNCVGFVCPEYFKNDLVYKTLWLQDSPAEDITSILYDVFDYFEDVREQGGRVFVHCFQGVSRSASLVIAYLMWREGQIFEDAFQYVKAARGVTNPNMGFACQLLQCQKRVHAVPASPNSLLRIYRMAPHSPYDSLHLVPKVLSHPSAQGLDSRGAFLVHVPSAIYVWIGRSCCSVMSNKAVVAANQVIRYERANGPCVIINEGNEPAEFWAALTDSQHGPDARAAEEVSSNINSLRFQKNEVEPVVQVGIGERRVDDYNLDFELFERALAGGVVPPFSVSHADSETCLPAREQGWGRLRQKFASGIMKEFVNSAKWGSDKMFVNDCYDMVVDANKDMVDCTTRDDLSAPLIEQCSSPDSSSGFPDTIHEGIEYPHKAEEYSVSLGDHLSPVMSPCNSPDSFSCFTSSSPKFSSKSPTLSPSNSDYASTFSFSPSSSNWSDLSYLSSQQPSPSGLESTDPFTDKNAALLYGEIPSSPKKMTGNQTLRLEYISLPYKRTSPSIAERRGSNPPPRMFLSSVDEPSSVRRNLVRSSSFSLPDLDDDDVMKDADSKPLAPEDNREELMLDIETVDSRKPPRSDVGSQLQSKDIIDKDPEVVSEVEEPDAFLSQVSGSLVPEGCSEVTRSSRES